MGTKAFFQDLFIFGGGERERERVNRGWGQREQERENPKPEEGSIPPLRDHNLS